MKSTDITDKWEQFRKQKGFVQRMSPDHPMDLFLGINDKGNAQIVLFTDIEPAKIKSSKYLEIVKRERTDKRWATQISLIDSSSEDVFARLCLDLFEVSQNVQNESEGLKRITSRFLAWQKMFASSKTELSINKLKGLVGEVTFMFEQLQKHYSMDTIIDAWRGPNGADRDFSFNDTWFEVKAVSIGKDTISISSLNQLEIDDTGYIVKYDVDESSSTDPSASSVSKTIDSFRKVLESCPDAYLEFNNKLLLIGYIDKDTYDNIYFVHKGPEYYIVDNSFPRLTPELVRKEIVSAEYEISLPSIEKWRVNSNDIWN